MPASRCYSLFWGYDGDSAYKQIDFSNTISVKQPDKQVTEPGLLRVAVAAMISPKETFVYYRELLDYIGAKVLVGKKDWK